MTTEQTTVSLPPLTHSSTSTLKTCPRKYRLRYVDGLRKIKVGDALNIGSMFHAALETNDKAGPDAAYAAIDTHYGTIPGWCQTGDDINEWSVQHQMVRTMFAGHLWRWSEDNLKVVATELVFTLPIVNPDTGHESRTFALGGKLDRIVKLPDGRLAVMEYKTCGVDISDSTDYWPRLRMDQQISVYVLAARALGHDVATVLYDATRKPSIRPKLVKGARETPTEWAARYLADIYERPGFYYARQEIPRLESDLDEFRAELWQMAGTIREAQNHGRFFRNTNSCLFPYRCEYFDVCSNNLNPSERVPDGFEIVTDLHPELSDTGD